MVIFEMHKSDLGFLPKICKISGSYCWQVKKSPLIGISLCFNYTLFMGLGNNKTSIKIHLLSRFVKNILLIIIFTSFQGDIWKHKPDLGILPKVFKINGSYRWQVKKQPLIRISISFKLLVFFRDLGITEPPLRFTSLLVVWSISH